MDLRRRIHAFLNPDARTVTAQPVREAFTPIRGLRRGMWVIYGTQVGILVGLDGSGQAKVQIVEGDGTNAMTLEQRPDRTQHLVPLIITTGAEHVKQARHEQIPAPRRPPEDLAARFGYKLKGQG